MIHDQTPYHLVPRTEADLVAHLAQVIAGGTWTRCDGSLCALTDTTIILVLNDSFTEDSVQEYTFVRLVTGTLPTSPPDSQQTCNVIVQQIESLTVSWCDPATLAAQIADCLRSVTTYGPAFLLTVTLGLDHRCALCE